MNEELKLCPLCGNTVVMNEEEDWYVFNCNNCELIYQVSYGEISNRAKELAIKDWNTRPLEDALQAKLRIAINTLQLFAAGSKLNHIAENALAKIV